MLLSILLSGFIGQAASALSYGTSDLELVDIHMHPLKVYVGDSFTIGATIINNSKDAIYFHDLCESPLTVQFDANVQVLQGYSCEGFNVVELKPGESTVVTGPPSGIIYKAISAGNTKATVTFTYTSSVDTTDSISRSVEFSIFEEDNTEIVPAEFGKPFGIKINQTAFIESEDVRIKFVDVTEDSRCPSDVVCVWEGQATILLDAVLGSEDANRFHLTIRGSGGSVDGNDSKIIDQYSVTLASLQPYPKASEKIKPSDYVAELVVDKLEGASVGSKSVLLKAVAMDEQDNIDRLIAAWNMERGGGGAFLYVEETDTVKKIVLKFAPSPAGKCLNESSECIDGLLTYVSADNALFRTGESVHIEVDGSTLFLTTSNSREYSMNITGIRARPWETSGSIVTLKEGERSGPLLVEQIYSNYIKGLNFVEYPISTGEGFPITLHIGESASNGCTIMLTLLRTENEEKAVFLKTVDYDRPCPICWHQPSP
jgi:hypothetical protein